MLVFKEVKDYDVIKEFLSQEDIDYNKSNNSIIYGGFEDDNLFGLCKINITESKGLLDFLIIKSDYRGDNLGDGLLKSTLNKVDKIGVSYVYYPNIDNYLLKKGFVKTDKNSLFVQLPDFFSKCCNNCGRS